MIGGSLAIIGFLILMMPPLLAFAQENPFQFGSDANPFEVGGGYSPGGSQSNTLASGREAVLSNGTIHYVLPQDDTILQILSNTDWSGTYGDSTGSTTIDGHGSKDITLLSCSNTYSADFQKKGEGNGFLTLNIIQNESNPAFTNAMNNSTVEHLLNLANANSNSSLSNSSTATAGNILNNYTAKVQKEIPMDMPQITNTRTATAQFGTLSVSGSC